MTTALPDLRRCSGRRRPPRGLTLLEMLVVMVIMSMVVVLVSQALEQLGRIERLLLGSRLDTVQRLSQAGWLTEAFESMLPAELDSPQRFIGSPRELSGLTTAPPSERALGIARLHLVMAYLPQTDETELRLAIGSPQEDAKPEAPAAFTPLSRWPGRAGRFRYLDASGRWQDDWPSPQGRPEPDQPLLPAAIQVVTGLKDVPEWIARVQTSPAGMPSRKRFMQL